MKDCTICNVVLSRWTFGSEFGRHAHCRSRSMGVKRVEELAAYQLAVEFKRAVYRIARASPGVARDFAFRDQLFSAASSVQANLVEGFDRFGARAFQRFLGYARASLSEARMHLEDGIDRQYFEDSTCADALTLARRAGAAIMALHRSLNRFARPTRPELRGHRIRRTEP